MMEINYYKIMACPTGIVCVRFKRCETIKRFFEVFCRKIY